MDATTTTGATASRASAKARELAIARALAACERTAPDSSVNERKRQQILESLRDGLKSIEGDVDAAIWKAYATRIDRLDVLHSTTRGEVASTSGAPLNETSVDAPPPTAGAAATTRRAYRPSSAKTTTPRGVVAGITEVVSKDDDGCAASSAARRSLHGPPSTKTLTAEDEVELRRQRAIQDGLTDEMSELASGLKANALALERGLGRSSAAVAELESRLGANVHGVKSSAKRQDAAFRANRRGSCWTWLILALVGVLFAWTYVVIKVSSDRTKRSRAKAL